MTALAAERLMITERWTYKQFPLAVGNKAWKGGKAVLDLSTAKCEPGHEETDLFDIGTFDETVDATAAEKLVNVNLGKEIEVQWWANAGGGDAVVATDVGSLVYILDDQTVTRTATAHSVAGRCWAVDATKGVAVERLQAVPTFPASLEGLEGGLATATAFASNDSIIADNPNSGTIFDVPTTGAASTVTLPATAVDGTILYFVADGTKNGHTVQYRDATGPVNLTTALTASKRHVVMAIRFGTKWHASAYISP